MCQRKWSEVELSAFVLIQLNHLNHTMITGLCEDCNKPAVIEDKFGNSPVIKTRHAAPANVN